MHRVIWPRNGTFRDICVSYVTYVKSHYGSSVTVVFDGYPENVTDQSTKFTERSRREKKNSSVNIIFDADMTPPIAQEKFLGNSKNKNRLIGMLTRHFVSENIQVFQAKEDADTLIVRKAIEAAPNFASSIIVGEDVDLVVILTSLSKNMGNVFLLKPGRKKTIQKIYNRSSLGDEVVANNMLFLHAFSGCDTTSYLYNQGTAKIIKTLKNNPELLPCVQVFQKSNSTAAEIADAGQKFLLCLYGCKTPETTTLNVYGYKCFVKTAFKNKHTLASLPPTEEAAKQHSLRTYYQVQSWLGVDKNPTEWGWEISKNGLVPVTSTQKPAPDAILNQISCKCKKGCRAGCSCRKSGLSCTIICSSCFTDNACTNRPVDAILDKENVDDPEEVQDQAVDYGLSSDFEEESDAISISESEGEKRAGEPGSLTLDSEDIDRPGPSH